MKYLFIGLIKFYRSAISPFTPPTCRFYPTCSEYGLEAYRRFGVWKGTYLTVKRISKCHPFHAGGVDLVPEKRKSKMIIDRETKELSSLNIQISKEAAKWYKKELDIDEDTSYVRFFVRYGGIGGNVPGFSLGVSNEKPEDLHTSIEVEGVTFFVETKDEWYFEDKDLKISYSRKKQEPTMKYITN